MGDNRNLRDYKLIKTIQLIVVCVLEAAFLIVILSNRWLRESIFLNKSLFSLCVITYILMILFLICMCIDLYEIRSIVSDNHSLQKQTYLDSLTGIPNRYSLDLIFATYNTPESLRNVGCILFELENLAEVNETQGRAAGDHILQNFSMILEDICDSLGFVGRNSGNEFVVVINNCTEHVINDCFTAIAQRVAMYNNDENNLTPITYKQTYTLNSDENLPSFSRLLTATYQKLEKK